MKTQLKKGALDMCVLAILAEGDRYAYDIVAQLAGGLDMSEGTIYPLMRRLQNEAWVTTYLVESDSGPPRKYYRLTEAGNLRYLDMRRQWIEFTGEVDKILGVRK
ncbi:PadR family transcriptional regulator [Methylococcus sp. EFPC2]|uniref:PadR family transcriptional regulator n=1 Tax=Methylococcus sp. EFPC2 TaxID=2812648 RepID=UPI001967B883|nr:PadR family transcriptional regulator [Methylococcus sp. EFPC2]QSA97469.1 PadR family transcriptional regulator [Methylococcus sp. EFPC2]